MEGRGRGRKEKRRKEEKERKGERKEVGEQKVNKYFVRTDIYKYIIYIIFLQKVVVRLTLSQRSTMHTLHQFFRSGIL